MIKSIQKIAAGLAAGLVVMAGALPAIGQVDAIQVTFKSPAGGASIEGTRTIEVQATSSPHGVKTNGVIKDFTIRIQADGESNTSTCQPGESPGKCRTENYQTPPAGTSRAKAEETLTLDWRTREVTPENGIFDVVSVVRSNITGVNDKIEVLHNVHVNNPTERPRSLAVSDPVRGEPKLTVSWAPNSEVDLVGYQVSRSVGDGPFTGTKSVDARTSYQDTEVPFDTPIRYEVVAFRRNSTGGKIASPPATSAAVTVQSPPPPPSPTPSSTPGGVKASTKTPGAPELKDLSGKLGTPDAGGKTVKPISLAAPNSITGPRRDGGSGFGRLLPFGMDAPQSLFDEEFAESVGEAIRNPGRMISQEIRVNPMRFIAAAVLLFVTAGHLGRGAQSLFRSAKSATASSSSSPAIPA